MNKGFTSVLKLIGRPYIVYGVLALCILGPLLNPGYVLTWSMVAGPGNFGVNTLYGFEEWAHSLYPGSAPLDVLFLGARALLPDWVGQKILLIAVFCLSGLGAYRLVGLAGVVGWAKYYAGFLYAVNPFVYTRFLAGQWWICLGYALTPFALWSFNTFLRDPSVKTSGRCVLLTSVVGAVYPQGLLLLLVMYIVTGIMNLAYSPQRIFDFKRQLVFGIPSVGLFVLVNCYWLLPLLTTEGTLYHQITDADKHQFAATSLTSRGLLFDIASMHGFWRSGYIYAVDLLPLWEIWFLVILFLAVLGAMCYAVRAVEHPDSSEERYARYQSVSLCLLWFLMLFLAAGAASDVLRPGYEWLWDNVAPLKGFRDSQKFVGVICLGYAFLGGLGVHKVQVFLLNGFKGFTRGIPHFLLTLLVCVPLVYTFTIFGFYNQVKSTDYPEGWYQAREYFDQDPEEYRILFLPWHWFMDYEWLPNRSKRLMNPGPSFFSQQVLHSQDHEVPGVPSQSTSPANDYVEFLLKNRDDISNLGELLAPIGVKYIVLVPEVDFDQYGFLYDQTDIVLGLRNQEISVFQNAAFAGIAYGSNSVRHVDDFEEFLELSRNEDITKHLFLLGSGQDQMYGDLISPQVTASRETPAHYQIRGASTAYLAASGYLGQGGKFWRYGASPEFYSLGVVPVFRTDARETSLTYSRYYNIYLPSRIVSLMAFGGMIVWLIFGNTLRNFVSSRWYNPS